jgi:polyisoprenoid-binding protein YceI
MLLATLSLATETKAPMVCTLTHAGPVSVTWTAFKTPMKAGVGGTFDKIAFTPLHKSGKNFNELFKGATLTINETSVNSGNKGRDAKLIKYFFDMMEGAEIHAKVINIQSESNEKGKPKTGIMTTEITMNKVVKVVPLKYVYDQGKLRATGTIDLFDFKAAPALQALNIACFDLHQGKTWNDVTIDFATNIEAVCTPSK